jgi:carboxylesterase type B
VASLGAPSLAELRARPAVSEAILKKPITCGFGVVDGYVVPEHPAQAFAKGRQNDVPLLVGWNADEGTLFAARVTFSAQCALLCRSRPRPVKGPGGAGLEALPAGIDAR